MYKVYEHPDHVVRYSSPIVCESTHEVFPSLAMCLRKHGITPHIFRHALGGNDIAYVNGWQYRKITLDEYREFLSGGKKDANVVPQMFCESKFDLASRASVGEGFLEIKFTTNRLPTLEMFRREIEEDYRAICLTLGIEREDCVSGCHD